MWLTGSLNMPAAKPSQPDLFELLCTYGFNALSTPPSRDDTNQSVLHAPLARLHGVTASLVSSAGVAAEGDSPRRPRNMDAILRTGHTPRAWALVIALCNHQLLAHETVTSTCLLVISSAARTSNLGTLVLQREFGCTKLENQAGRTI